MAMAVLSWPMAIGLPAWAVLVPYVLGTGGALILVSFVMAALLGVTLLVHAILVTMIARLARRWRLRTGVSRLALGILTIGLVHPLLLGQDGYLATPSAASVWLGIPASVSMGGYLLLAVVALAALVVLILLDVDELLKLRRERSALGSARVPN